MQALQIARHSRGLAPPPTPVQSETDIAAMTIGGDVILVDVTDFRLDGKVLAVVARWDGTLGIEYARIAEGRSWAGERSGYFPVVPTDPRTASESQGCIILGRVISRE